ncbi:MAG: hypothetical protein RL059_1484 [Bacteroidota bacterium]
MCRNEKNPVQSYSEILIAYCQSNWPGFRIIRLYVGQIQFQSNFAMDDVTRKSTTGFVFLFGHIAVSARETRRFFGSVEFDETKKGWLELKGRKSNKNSATKGMNGVERPDKGVARDIAKMGENRGRGE